MPNLIACRIASYGKFQHRAWDHLPSIGIRHIEIACPQAADKPDLRRRLADSGLRVSSFQCFADLQKPDIAETLRPQFDACAEFGARIAFISLKAGDMDRDTAWACLRAVGDLADAADVTLAIETHPDLVTNGDVGRQTMHAVNHPRIRVNFDTANVYFYNEGRTAVSELPQLLDFIAAVHIKDTDGGYQSWCFPTLGTGVVDFPEVFRLLGKRGFAGPYTMELEGVKGQDLDEPARLQYVADSVQYLRSIGTLE